MSPPPSPAEEFWPFFPVFFAGLWVLVCFIISHMGWRSFSARYAMPARPSGRIYTSPSSRFGNILASYRNVVRVVFTDEGIYFCAMFLFRAFHPPFLVPWESVRRVEKKDGWFFKGYRLDIENAAGEIQVWLPKKVENDLFRYHKAA
jgi:hypothetical protein